MTQQLKVFATQAWWYEFDPAAHIKVEGENHLHNFPLICTDVE